MNITPPSRIRSGDKNLRNSTTYLMRYVCYNCGKGQLVGFPKGTQAPMKLEDTPCLRCGCNTLQKENK